MQTEFEFIPHPVGSGIVIYQRPIDGYINATAMCRAAGKSWFDYRRQKTTGPFISALSTETGIPGSELFQSVRGGLPDHQGTWAHPRVAIHLAQWLSPEFAVQVTGWVFDWMSGKGATHQPAIPYHLRRYIANYQNV